MKLICHFELRRKAGDGLEFKGKAGNSQVDKKEEAFDKQILAEPPRDRHRRESDKQTLLDLPLSVTLSSYYAKVISLPGADLSI